MAFAFQGRTQIRSVRWLRQLQSNALHDVCRHLDRTNAFSVAHGGFGGFKRDRVASHAKTFQPKEQGTRDLGDLFEEGLRKERERMIALIKPIIIKGAYGLAYEATQVQKLYSLNPAVVASELHGSGRGGPTQVRPCRRQPAGFLAPKKQKNTQKTLIKSKLNQN